MAEQKPPKSTASRSTTRRRSAASSSLTKDDIQDVLIGTQKKLLDAEKAQKAAEAQAAEAKQELEGLKAELAKETEFFADHRIRLIMSEHRAEKACRDYKRVASELGVLSRVLMEAQAKADAAEKSLAEHQAALNEQRAENSALKASVSAEHAKLQATVAAENDRLTSVTKEYERRLHDAEAKIKALEQALARETHRNEATANEVTGLTGMLRTAEEQADINLRSYLSAMHWLRSFAAVMLPEAAQGKPGFEELSRIAEGLINNHAFNPEWYSWNYQDVQEQQLTPGVHYLRFGLAEGRHPTDIMSSEAAKTAKPAPSEHE